MSFPSEFHLNHLQVIRGEDARLLGDMDLMQPTDKIAGAFPQAR